MQMLEGRFNNTRCSPASIVEYDAGISNRGERFGIWLETQEFIGAQAVGPEAISFISFSDRPKAGHCINKNEENIHDDYRHRLATVAGWKIFPRVQLPGISGRWYLDSSLLECRHVVGCPVANEG
jgi:hypothetical protein